MRDLIEILTDRANRNWKPRCLRYRNSNPTTFCKRPSGHAGWHRSTSSRLYSILWYQWYHSFGRCTWGANWRWDTWGDSADA